MPTTTYDLSVLLKKEGPYWVAQCLQYDIAGQGKTIEDALYHMERCFVGSLACRQREGLEGPGVQPAPDEYWKLYDRAKPLCEQPSDPFMTDRMPIAVKPEMRVV